MFARLVAAIAAAALLAGCAGLGQPPQKDYPRDAAVMPDGGVACSLTFVFGDLVAENGRVVLATSPNFSPYWDYPVPLEWPDGTTIRPTDDGQVEVVDDSDAVRARTGTFVQLDAAGTSGGSILFRGEDLVICPGSWPRPAPRPDGWTTETPAP